MIWRLRGQALNLDRPKIMGIVNVTPDSFSDGGTFFGSDAAIAHGRALAAVGADILDIGGESTRPHAVEVPAEEEAGRVIPVIKALAQDGFVVSVDTSKPTVAEAAIEAGAVVVNDVTGFRDPDMRSVAARYGVGVVAMHMAGTPKIMQQDPTYDDVVAEVGDYLVSQARLLEASGVGPDQICIDPGIGFGKTVDHNLQLLAGTRELASLGYPLMIGVSRKRFLGELLHIDSAPDRDIATAIVSGLVGFLGARVLRVHDVIGSQQAARLSAAIVAHT